MNRSELVRALAERVGISQTEAERVVVALFDARHGIGILADALDRGERVVIKGFGTFSVQQRKARNMPDPRGGGWRAVGPSRVPRFKPATPLRGRLA